MALILEWSSWLGGVHYLRNLIAAVQALPTHAVEFVGFAGKKGKDPSEDFPGMRIVRTASLDRGTVGSLVRRAVRKLTGRDLLLQGLLLANGIRVVSHTGSRWSRSPMAVIGWIPDFQHIHLPEFFSAEEREQRDRNFLLLCESCDALVVSSACALADLAEFCPASVPKAHVLRFVAGVEAWRGVPGLAELSSTYNFQPPYFILPNQFWKHKNHAAVLRALRVLKQRGRDATVLATGMTADPRDPDFFDALMRLAEECEVQDCFRVLGAIPFNHLLGLMQHAVAFLNPSLFEGWSTSVEEAKSMGKLVLLSDIAVHREQAPQRAVFFDPEDPEELAGALDRAQRDFNLEADLAFQAAARAAFPLRRQAFGEAYLAIVEAALRPRAGTLSSRQQTGQVGKQARS